jgi:hypothetical protein
MNPLMNMAAFLIPLRSLSDFSDFEDYSSDDQPRARSRAASRRQSLAAGTSGGRGGYIEQPSYAALDDDEEERTARGGLLDPNDPFADPTDFLGSIGGSSTSKAKDRMECESRQDNGICFKSTDIQLFPMQGLRSKFDNMLVVESSWVNSCGYWFNQ